MPIVKAAAAIARVGTSIRLETSFEMYHEKASLFSAAIAVAKRACRLAEIDRRRFPFLVQQTPHFATHVMKTLANRLRHMNAVAAGR